MQKLYKVLFGSLGILMASAVSAYPLQDYNGIQFALNNGRTVSMSLDLSQCTPVGTAPATQTKGGLSNIGAYRITSDGTLSFSDEHFTVTTTNAQPIQQFLRYQVRTDNTVAFTSYIFSIPAYTLISQVGYTCTINRGIRFFTE